MGETTEAQAAPAKKSVALSGVVAGNTAICRVGRAGNDLHYRCLLYTSPSPRDRTRSRMPSSA